ncbi:hypothetical protein MHYP_G00137790 [Metynnis hypsauchen]
MNCFFKGFVLCTVHVCGSWFYYAFMYCVFFFFFFFFLLLKHFRESSNLQVHIWFILVNAYTEENRLLTTSTWSVVCLSFICKTRVPESFDTIVSSKKAEVIFPFVQELYLLHRKYRGIRSFLFVRLSDICLIKTEFNCIVLHLRLIFLMHAYRLFFLVYCSSLLVRAMSVCHFPALAIPNTISDLYTCFKMTECMSIAMKL